jgi:hypothetical protein
MCSRAAPAAGQFLKILLDIFRYIGDGSYRAATQQCVASKISGSGRPSEFIVVAHSLGTVIAVDSLVNSAAWQKTDVVTLVTLGSPLRRFFFRFFPNLYFPCTAARCANLISTHVGRFRWVNCYRPKDYVGTEIGFDRCHWTVGVDTKQSISLPKAHSNYWGDGEIRAMLLNVLKTLQYSSSGGCTAQSHHPGIGFRPSAIRAAIPGATAVAAACLFSLVPVLAIFGGARSWIIEQRTRLRLLDETTQRGVRVPARVKYWRDPELVADAHSNSVVRWQDCFAFEYKIETNQSQRWDFCNPERGLFAAAFWRLDLSRLSILTRAEQCHAEAVTIDSPCMLPDLTLRYSEEHPGYFVVADFPPTIGLGARLWGYTEAVLACFLAALMSACIFFALGLGVFMGLIGEFTFDPKENHWP